MLHKPGTVLHGGEEALLLHLDVSKLLRLSIALAAAADCGLLRRGGKVALARRQRIVV